MVTDRCLHLHFTIDTNCINAKQTLKDINRLEQWKRDGLIEIIMADVAHQEALNGHSPRRSAKALTYIYSVTTFETDSELEMKERITGAIFPDGLQKPSDQNDAWIVAQARKYHAILVTADGTILRARPHLKALGVEVMTGAEAVELVQRRIKVRDENAKRYADKIGTLPPDWTGKD